MRHIVYRAKRVDGICFWAEGYIVKTPITAEFNDANGSFFDSGKTRYCIVTEFGIAHEIDPETICQFTGLKDKNGKEIYEGDILKYFDRENAGIYVKFEDGMFLLTLNKFSILMTKEKLSMLEIIGNIYENPELLKAKEGKV